MNQSTESLDRIIDALRPVLSDRRHHCLPILRVLLPPRLPLDEAHHHVERPRRLVHRDQMARAADDALGQEPVPLHPARLTAAVGRNSRGGGGRGRGRGVRPPLLARGVEEALLARPSVCMRMTLVEDRSAAARGVGGIVFAGLASSQLEGGAMEARAVERGSRPGWIRARL